MTERGRRVGIDAYTSLIQRYGLNGLLDQVMDLQGREKLKDGYSPQNKLEELLQKTFYNKSTSLSASDKASWPPMPWDDNMNKKSLWEHQRSVLISEIRSIVARNETSIILVLKLLLNKLKYLEQNHAAKKFIKVNNAMI